MNLDRRLWRLILLAAGGVLTGLCLVFPAVGFLEWLTLIPAGLVLLRILPDGGLRLRRLWGYGLFYFMTFYMTGFHWFVSMYPLEFTGITKAGALVVVLFAWVGLSFLQAAMGGLYFLLAGLLCRGRLGGRFPFARPFLIALAYAVYEWTQNLGWWGVPWSRLPLGQTKYLAGLQTASLLGSYFVTFLLVLVNLLLAYLIGEALAKGREVLRDRLCRAAALCVLAVLVFQYGAGAILWTARDPRHETETVRVAAVQGNISSKWDNDNADRETREVYGEYTRRAAEAGATIVVWPETAVTSVIRNSEKSSWFRFCSGLASESGITLLVGGFSSHDGGLYNSILCFLPDGTMHETVYDKRRLVPFGEFVPLEGLIQTLVPPLAELVMSGSDLDEGTEPRVLFLEEGAVGSLICFDSIYDRLTRDSVLEGAELLCLSTNDSWFGTSRALYMHTAQAQLRAVESGRWLLRSANTGFTVAVNARGEITDSIPVAKEGVLVTEVALREEMTPYSILGNLFVWLGLFLVGGLSIWEILAAFRRKKFAKGLDKRDKK
jgi:apolipoprotein N-acyltransferase